MPSLSSDWPGVFRHQMLHLMPAEALGKHFSDQVGCPTKELYGMAGAIFLKEFFDLTIPQTVERYLTDAAWQYALNVNPMEASLSHATVERHLKLFAENDLASEVFHRVTSALIEAFAAPTGTNRFPRSTIPTKGEREPSWPPRTARPVPAETNAPSRRSARST